jgi:hypothetical protein
MTLEDKVNVYKELSRTIEELENQKKGLVQEILQLIPKETKTVCVLDYQVKRMSRFSIKTSLESARAFGAVKVEEVVDKKKIKQLIEQGQFIPDVSEIHYIQVSSLKPKLTTHETEVS